MQVAIDVGYGFTKALSDRRGRSIFPSAVTSARGTGDLAAALGGGSAQGHLRVQRSGLQADEYLVGQAALSAGAARSWSADGDGREDYPLLVLAALAAVGAEGPVDLALGLPLSVYLSREQRKALRDRIAGIAAWVSLDGHDARHVQASYVRVLPQAVGAYYAALLGPDGARLAGQGVGVVDVGYHTTDYLLMVPGDSGASMPDEARSGSIDAGMSQVVDTVRQHVSGATGTPFAAPEGLIEGALRNTGHITVRGEVVDLRPAYTEALQDLAGRIEAEIQRAWGQRIDYLAATLLAGGGGTAVTQHLRLQGAQIVTDPVFANAAGFLAMLGQARKQTQSGVAGR